jgi:L-asparaginase II
VFDLGVPMVAEDRGEVREATHSGHLVLADADGRVLAALGNPDRLTYFRSSAKPFQAIASLRSGARERFGLTDEHVAVMAASHAGEPRHVELVRDLLRRADVPEDALACGAHWPLSDAAAQAARAAMAAPIPVFNNCSGKHAGMLAAARALGASLEGYLDPGHPVQVEVRRTVEAFTGCPPEAIRYGTDGCSAPNAAVPLRTMAQGFARLLGSPDPVAQGVVRAMTEHPFLVGGTDRFDTRLMEASRGRLLAKGGAAGLHCLADRESGRGLAVKLESGNGALVPPAVMAALKQLGWLSEASLDSLRAFASPTLLNYRRLHVGRAYPVFQLPTVTAV